MPPGKLAEAINLFHCACTLQPKDYQIPNFQGLALKSLGRHEEAMASYRKQLRLGEQHLEQHPHDSRACIMAANAHANMQDAEKSALYAARAIAMDPEDPMLLYNVACLYSVLGRTDDCLTALEQAVNKGWGDKAWLEHDSDFDAVRQEPQYLTPIRTMQQRQAPGSTGKTSHSVIFCERSAQGDNHIDCLFLLVPTPSPGQFSIADAPSILQ